MSTEFIAFGYARDIERKLTESKTIPVMIIEIISLFMQPIGLWIPPTIQNGLSLSIDKKIVKKVGLGEHDDDNSWILCQQYTRYEATYNWKIKFLSADRGEYSVGITSRCKYDPNRLFLDNTQSYDHWILWSVSGPDIYSTLWDDKFASIGMLFIYLIFMNI